MSNVGTLDRIVRALGGLALMIAPFAAAWPTPAIIVGVIVGAILVVTAAIGVCPIYAVLGLSSKQPRLGRP